MCCTFCEIAKGKTSTNIIFESENICCFLDIAPINEGHMLIITKEHYVDIDEMPDEILEEITFLSKKLVRLLKEKYKPNGYSIMQNGGQFADFGHYHLHVFPRFKNDGFTWAFSDEVFECGESLSNEIKTALNVL